MALLSPPYWLVLVLVVYLLCAGGVSFVRAIAQHPEQWYADPSHLSTTRRRFIHLLDAVIAGYVAALLVVHL